MSLRFVYGYRVQVAARQVRSNSLPHPISSPSGEGVEWAEGWGAWPVAVQVFMCRLLTAVNSDAYIVRGQQCVG